MNMIVFLATFAVVGSVPMLIWSLNSGRDARVTPEQLLGARSVDWRQRALQESPTDRIFRPAVEGMARLVRRFAPVGRIEALDRRRAMAALPNRWTVERLLAAKVVGGICGSLFGLLQLASSPGTKMFILTVALAAFGWLLPNILVKNKADKRQSQLAAELPDTLDQITIAVEAGLGFDAAMDRVAKTGDGPMAQELARTLQHMTAGLSRAEALRGLADRNKVQELRQFAVAILQADQYGVPMAQVLRVQSSEARRRRRQKAEEKAMKLPVKLLFPLLFCILPALFVVVIGPAGLMIMKTLKAT
jgi:tight adherence protein C